MNYQKKEIKKGIKLQTIKTDKFKTNLVAIFITTAMKRENVTKNAVISSILRRGSKNMPSQEDISINMEKLYGASFDCGLDKTGDNQVLKIYVETVNDNFLPGKQENILRDSINKALEIAFDPYLENGEFKKEYVEQEKNTIKQIINSRIDNKDRYSLNRCIEEMYKGEIYSYYKYGFSEDIEAINGKNLYEAYQKLIDNAKIDIFISGDINDETINEVMQNENIKKLKDREPDFMPAKIEEKENRPENLFIEKQDVTQGKLVVGLDTALENNEEKYYTMVYNSILGGSATSKIFQNVREKAHLAYVASSSYLRFKGNIFVKCGIEISNFEKALDLIREQLEAMKKGDFTDEDIDSAKRNLIANIRLIQDEQDTEIAYYFGQELMQENIDTEEYVNKLENVKREDIINVANKVNINTIYFLKDKQNNNNDKNNDDDNDNNNK